jgi:DNA-binding beta-propeller fold protein YncE
MANNKDFKVKNGIQPTVYHEGVGTVTSAVEGYSMSSAVYDSKSFSTATQNGNASGVFFKPDGTKAYVVGPATNAVLYQYGLSTAWDASTGSYDSVSFTLTDNAGNVFFKSDGTAMYVMNSTDDALDQYNLSTAWDITSSSYSQSFSYASQDDNAKGIFFKPDGTKMYIAGWTNDKVYEYNLSTAWDISTASYVQDLSIRPDITNSNPTGVFFTSDGLSMIVNLLTGGLICKYTLSTAWDISSASYTNVSLDVTGVATNPYQVSFKPDGTKMFVVSPTTDGVFQYSTVLTTNTLDLSTGSVFEITPTSDIEVNLSNPAASGTVSQATLLLDGAASSEYDITNATLSNSFSVSQDTQPHGLAFKPDGTRFYVVGNGNNTVYQYDISTAWDSSTAAYNSVSFSISSEESTATGITFKPDGTKMYVVGIDSDSIHQYSLSTAWDLSTASYDSVSSYLAGSDPTGVVFKPDGTRLYTSMNTGDTVDEWTLTTAWDISTVTFSTDFSVASEETVPNGLDISEDGTLMFIVGQSSDTVYKYNLSTAWDLSTASYSGESIYVQSEDGLPEDIRFGYSGTRMYLIGSSNDKLYEYLVGSPATITYDSTLEFAGGTAPTSPAIGETDVITISTRDGGTSYQAVQAIDGAA